MRDEVGSKKQERRLPGSHPRRVRRRFNRRTLLHPVSMKTGMGGKRMARITRRQSAQPPILCCFVEMFVKKSWMFCFVVVASESCELLRRRRVQLPDPSTLFSSLSCLQHSKYSGSREKWR
jgi:hypothetical protein